MYSEKITPIFESRRDAGRKLAECLSEYKGQAAVVLAIPNGGVPVAAEIADTLEAEIDLVVVRKIPFPLYPEAGFGAIADNGAVIIDEGLVKKEGLTREQVNNQVSIVTGQVRQRSLLYRKDRQLVITRGRIAIICDDGLASGFTMLAAIESVRRRRPRKILVAVPVASSMALERVKKEVDSVVTVAEGSASHFTVADYYKRWIDVPDKEVIRLLEGREKIHPRRTYR